jgi:potassium-transporting ATPase potassium-binding subunit
MTPNGILNLLIYSVLILLVTKPLGVFMTKLFAGERTFLHPVLRPLEKLTYRLCRIHENSEQRWTQYAASLIAFSVMGFIFAYVIQRLQGFLPLNLLHFGTSKAPSGATSVTPDLAFNTAVSFISNTNWQNYGGETTYSHFVQMTALTVQNFLSAAAGVAVSVALIRGFARKQVNNIGNFWVDTVRATLYIFLPLSLLGALFLCSQGVIQNFKGNTSVQTVEGATQTIAQGPVASQEAIKMVGTNGGGFFNANSAHPFENPTPLTNLIQLIMIFAIPAGLTYTFGMMVGDKRQGWALFGAMGVLFLAGVLVCNPAEQKGNPQLAMLGLETKAGHLQTGGNMEGKEVRFGIASSALFAVITTDASCGAVNSMHDSFTPLGGLVPLFNIQLGEVVFGGVGAGIKGMLLFAILAVFIAGLMVGRTPEYIGKKIEQKEVKMAMLALIIMAANILVFTGISSVAKFKANGYWNPPGAATANVTNNGPHGFSEILYAYTSTNGNNGSAFGGLSGNTPWYNFSLGLAMLIGRFLFIIPMLAVAGSLAGKRKIPVTDGTLPTHGPLFVGLLIGTVIIVGALTYFPALSLGPIVEHFLMQQGKLFSMVSFTIWS